MRPNVVLIVLDTARADCLSSYGYKRKTTPNIDKIAEEGIRFKNAFSPSPWTLPSHFSYFTGKHPCEHRMIENNISAGKNIFTMREKNKFRDFLPRVLKRQGYKTVAFSNNPWISCNFGFHKGFDSFFDVWRSSQNQSLLLKAKKFIRESVPQRFHPIINNLKSFLEWLPRSDSGASNSVRLMKKWFSEDYNPEIPFFMFFNFMEPHLPYTPPKPFDELFLRDKARKKDIKKVNQDHLKFNVGKVEMYSEDFEILRSLYDGEIAYLDSKLKKIFDYLRNLKIFDNTLLIITSDHGENIGEHNLMGHQFCLYNTLLKVPLIIRYPNLNQREKVMNRYVQASDIYFTILDILQIKKKELDVKKRSLINQDYNEYIISEYESPKITLGVIKNRFSNFQLDSLEQELRCIYLDKFKYIWSSKEKNELYDLSNDPEEKNNVIQKYPRKALKLDRLLKSWLASRVNDLGKSKSDKNGTISEKDVDEEIKRKLKGLGYI